MPLDVDSLTIGEVRKIKALFGCTPERVADDTAFEVGRAYLIRTPTVYHLGRVVRITAHELVLDEAGWLVETGLFSPCIEKGTYSEYEPMGNGVVVPRANISDATPWKHALPKDRK